MEYIFKRESIMAITTISEPSRPTPASSVLPWQPGHPVWQLGFRPFYLLAALFAAVSIPLWLASYLGVATASLQVSMGWHMHEMVFGFAVAVVVGFLFTAGRNWTGLPTPQGAHLMALAAIWLAGRVAMLAAPAPVAAAIDLLFLPLCAWSLFQVLWRSGNHRNLFLVGLLVLLTVANGLYHASVMGMLALSYFVPVQAAIFVIVLIESVLGARVIPMFTRNGAPGSSPVASPKRALVAAGLMAAGRHRLALWRTRRRHCAAGAGGRRHVAGQPAGLAAAAHLARAAAVDTASVLRLDRHRLRAARLRQPALAAGQRRVSCADGGLDGGPDHRHDDAHHPGPYGPAAQGRQKGSGHVLAGAAGRRGPLAGGRCARSAGHAGAAAAGACWSVAFVLYAATYAQYLWRPRVDGREG